MQISKHYLHIYIRMSVCLCVCVCVYRKANKINDERGNDNYRGCLARLK